MSEYKLTLLYKKGLDHKTRNFIVLLVILVLTNIYTYFYYQNMKERYDDYKVENTRLQSELDNITIQMSSEDQLRQDLKRLQEKLFLSDEVMPNDNNTTITLTHIFNIFRRYNNYMLFDFRHVSAGTSEHDKEVKYNRYSLTGSAFVNILYVFLDQLERQPAFYTIESLELSSNLPEERGKVNFNLEINAYYTETGIDADEIPLKRLKRRTIPYNIFYHRLHSPFLREREVELIDINDISIIGMTRNQVFIRNTLTGTIESLLVGDRVRFGVLHSIDWQKQEAVFRLSRTGLAEYIRIKPD